MEWMRVRDSSSSLRISNLGRNGYRGVALSLSLTLSFSLLSWRKQGKKRGRVQERRKKGRGKNDKGAPIVSGNFANKTLPLFNID
jgi:hypothetical protein